MFKNNPFCKIISCIFIVLGSLGCGDEGLYSSNKASIVDDPTLVAELLLDNDTRVEFHEVTPGRLFISAWANTAEDLDNLYLVDPQESFLDRYERLSAEKPPASLIAAQQRAEQLRIQGDDRDTLAPPGPPSSSGTTDASEWMSCSSRRRASAAETIDCTTATLPMPPWWVQYCEEESSGSSSHLEYGRMGYSRVCSRIGITRHVFHVLAIKWLDVDVGEGRCHLEMGHHDWAYFYAAADGELYDWHYALAWW